MLKNVVFLKWPFLGVAKYLWALGSVCLRLHQPAIAAPKSSPRLISKNDFL